MKKFKILSLILAAIFMFSTVSLVACDTSTSNTNSTTQPPIEQPTEPPAEITPHTEHEGAGICSVCGIDYFDELVQYIKDHSTKTTETRYENDTYQIFWIESYYNRNKYRICYYEYQDNINIALTNDSYWPSITLDKYSVKDGEYKWNCAPISKLGKTNGGKFIASDISAKTSNYLTVSSSQLSSSEQNSAKTYMENNIGKMIDVVLIPILKDSKSNLTPSDFGFERFE